MHACTAKLLGDVRTMLASSDAPAPEAGQGQAAAGGRGSGAHRDEGVDGCRDATSREFGNAAKTEKKSFHSIRHAIGTAGTAGTATCTPCCCGCTATADAPEEFAALADYAVDDFMSEAASDVEVFATTEGGSWSWSWCGCVYASGRCVYTGTQRVCIYAPPRVYTGFCVLAPPARPRNP